jgi:hypothetical protein
VASRKKKLLGLSPATPLLNTHDQQKVTSIVADCG